jgi:hypothetical protein
MSDIDRLERDLDPPSPQEPIKIIKVRLSIVWEDGRTEELDIPDHLTQDIGSYVDEVEYEYNRDILENQAQKYGDPDGDY